MGKNTESLFFLHPYTGELVPEAPTPSGFGRISKNGLNIYHSIRFPPKGPLKFSVDNTGRKSVESQHMKSNEFI